MILHDGACELVEQAAVAMRAGDHARAHMELSRAEAVMSHLEHTLHGQPGSAPRNMVSMYGFCRRAVGRARLRRDPGTLDEVLRVLRQMRTTWDSIRAA